MTSIKLPTPTNEKARLVQRGDVDTKHTGKALITRALESPTIKIKSSSGADTGTGDVTFELGESGIVAGEYTGIVVDKYGRAVRGSKTSTGQGAQGTQGTQGSVGLGAQGYQGTQGITGSTGAQGTAVAGAQGSQGAVNGGWKRCDLYLSYSD